MVVDQPCRWIPKLKQSCKKYYVTQGSKACTKSRWLSTESYASFEVNFLYPRTVEATKTHWCVRRQGGTRTESLSQHPAFKGIICYCLALISGVYLWNHARIETTVIKYTRMPYSAPTPKVYDGLMPTENGFSFYTGLEMSKALVCDGEIVFTEQTDVTIIAHIVTAHSSSNPRKTPLSCIFWRTLNTLQETEVRKKLLSSYKRYPISSTSIWLGAIIILTFFASLLYNML